MIPKALAFNEIRDRILGRESEKDMRNFRHSIHEI